MASLSVSARCLACDWVPEGDPDKAAAKHTRDTKHPTAVVGEPVRVSRG